MMIPLLIVTPQKRTACDGITCVFTLTLTVTVSATGIISGYQRGNKYSVTYAVIHTGIYPGGDCAIGEICHAVT